MAHRVFIQAGLRGEGPVEILGGMGAGEGRKRRWGVELIIKSIWRELHWAGCWDQEAREQEGLGKEE